MPGLLCFCQLISRDPRSTANRQRGNGFSEVRYPSCGHKIPFWCDRKNWGKSADHAAGGARSQVNWILVKYCMTPTRQGTIRFKRQAEIDPGLLRHEEGKMCEAIHGLHSVRKTTPVLPKHFPKRLLYVVLNVAIV